MTIRTTKLYCGYFPIGLYAKGEPRSIDTIFVVDLLHTFIFVLVYQHKDDRKSDSVIQTTKNLNFNADKLLQVEHLIL